MSAFTEKQIREFFYDKNFSFQGNAYFPKLLKAEPNQSGTRNIYSCQVAFFTDVNQIPQDLSPEDRDYAMKAVVKNQQSLQMLNQFMMEAKQKFWPDFPMQAFINPVKHYDSYLRQDGKANPEFCKGKYWVNASSGESRQPAIVDTNRQVILDPSVIFSGMNAIMSIGLYPILKNKTGISANINAVMVLGGGTPTATGAGPVDVNSVFGDFANDMGGNVGHNAGSNLGDADRKSTRLNSSHITISYAVFCLKKKKTTNI